MLTKFHPYVNLQKSKLLYKPRPVKIFPSFFKQTSSFSAQQIQCNHKNFTRLLIFIYQADFIVLLRITKIRFYLLFLSSLKMKVSDTCFTLQQVSLYESICYEDRNRDSDLPLSF